MVTTAGDRPTPPLDEFLVKYFADDNAWWVLGSGDHLNLFDEAPQRWQAAEAAIARVRTLATSWTDWESAGMPCPRHERGREVLAALDGADNDSGCACVTAEDLGMGYGEGINPGQIAHVHPECSIHGDGTGGES